MYNGHIFIFDQYVAQKTHPSSYSRTIFSTTIRTSDIRHLVKFVHQSSDVFIDIEILTLKWIRIRYSLTMHIDFWKIKISYWNEHCLITRWKWFLKSWKAYMYIHVRKLTNWLKLVVLVVSTQSYFNRNGRTKLIRYKYIVEWPCTTIL